MNGAQLIAEERQRQVYAEGWTAEHDDEHVWGELASASAAYAKEAAFQSATDYSLSTAPNEWPWSISWWKPSPDPIRNLIKAGALIAAEIDRLQRKPVLDPSVPKQKDGPEVESLSR